MSVVDAEKHQEEKLGKLQGFQTRRQKRVVVVFGRQKGTASRQERDCPATQHVATGTRVESCLRRREGVDPESGCQQERDSVRRQITAPLARGWRAAWAVAKVGSPTGRLWAAQQDPLSRGHGLWRAAPESH